MPARTTVLIADDHPLFRAGLRQVLESQPSFELVHEAEEGNATLAGIRRFRPDIAVLDVNMPGQSGLEVARAIRRERLPVRVVFLTMYKDEDLINGALGAGVLGYVLKEGALLEIVDCLRAVATGQPYLSPALSALFLGFHRRSQALLAAKPGLSDLTPAERRVLCLVAADRTSKEIADELGLSPRTVDNHRAHISAKLGLQGTHSLLKFAYDNKSRLAS